MKISKNENKSLWIVQIEISGKILNFKINSAVNRNCYPNICAEHDIDLYIQATWLKEETFPCKQRCHF
jgi:hypothetical protein